MPRATNPSRAQSVGPTAVRRPPGVRCVSTQSISVTVTWAACTPRDGARTSSSRLSPARGPGVRGRRGAGAPPEQVAAVDEPHVGGRPLEVGAVPLRERVRLARRHHQVRAAPLARRPGPSPGRRRRRRPRWPRRATAAPRCRRWVRPAPSTGASRWAPTLGASGSGSGRASDGFPRRTDGGGQRVHLGVEARQVAHGEHVDRHPGGHERVVVLAPVLLLVEHHEVGRQLDDVRRRRVLGAADVREVGLLAEPGARDRTDAPRQEGLRHRRHQAHDTGATTTALTRTAPRSPRRTWRGCRGASAWRWA